MFGYLLLLSMEMIFLFHISLSAFMTGVTWFVQLVHYPTLLVLNKEQFQQYNQKQFKPTSFITFPFMLMELISGLWLLLDKPPVDLVFYFGANVSIIILIWLSTVMIQVPLHFKVSKYPSKNVLSRLIMTNWIRTALWTGKLILVVYVFAFYVMD